MTPHNRQRQKGVTLVEIIIVVTLIGILSYAIFPLISTTYDAWRYASRRIELLQIGRTSLTRLTNEVKKSNGFASNADLDYYLDYYPDWATATSYRFIHSSGDLMYGPLASFASDSLAAPIDSFEYVTYTRRLATGATRFRQINSVRFFLKVSDERHVLQSPAVPMEFISQAHIRTSREGWQFAKSSDFATESYRFDISDGDTLCLKAFCDRIDISAGTPIATQTATISWLLGSTDMIFDYVPAGDYFATCAPLADIGLQAGNDTVQITLDDGSEQLILYDQIVVTN